MSRVVGHIPIKISRYIYFSLKRGACYHTRVLEEKPLRSPLNQGGLEIKCMVKCNWTDEQCLTVLKDFVEKSYSFDGRLKDDSKAILQSLTIQLDQAEETNADDSDSSMELSDDEHAM